LLKKNGKLLILNEEQIAKWNEIKNTIMKEILLAKFTQVPIAKHVLLSTNEAKLLHKTRGTPMIREHNLEYVRNQLKISTS